MQQRAQGTHTPGVSPRVGWRGRKQSNTPSNRRSVDSSAGTAARLSVKEPGLPQTRSKSYTELPLAGDEPKMHNSVSTSALRHGAGVSTAAANATRALRTSQQHQQAVPGRTPSLTKDDRCVAFLVVVVVGLDFFLVKRKKEASCFYLVC